MAKGSKKLKGRPLGSLHDIANQKIKFSFEYYDEQSDEYCLSKFDQQQLRVAMLRLKDLSGKSLADLTRARTVLHFHEVAWEQTIKPSGFGNSPVSNFDPYQFSLVGINNQKARVYGGYQAPIFYVVWFDLEHKITPSILKHT